MWGRYSGRVAIFDLTESELRRRTSMKWRRFPADVLPMWVAEMDCRPAPEVVDAVAEVMRLGDTGYPGTPLYAEAFADYASDTWSWEIDTARVVGLPDVMHGIVGILDALTDPRSAVVVNPPVYPSFYEYLAWSERPVVEAQLNDAGRLDLEAIERAYAGADGVRPQAHLICNPHNPHGIVPTADELAQVAELANRYGVLVISDEIHAPLVSSHARHTPWTTVPGGETGVVVTSASKAWNLAGLKAAIAIGGEESGPRLRKLPSQVTGGGTHVGILAHAAALTDARAWVEQCLTEIETNRRLLSELLTEHLPQIRYTPGPATYLAWLDCTGLGLDDPHRTFLDRGRVAFNPGPAFGTGGEQHVRMNLATNPEIIRDGVARMVAALDA